MKAKATNEAKSIEAIRESATSRFPARRAPGNNSRRVPGNVREQHTIEQSWRIGRQTTITGLSPKIIRHRSLGMAAKFREVARIWVDENLPSGGQGIVVPSRGSMLVILQDGKGLKVQSTLPPKVRVYEFQTNQEQSEMAKKALNPSEAKQRFGDGSWRIFRIEADAPVGLDKVKVEAKNTKGLSGGPRATNATPAEEQRGFSENRLMSAGRWLLTAVANSQGERQVSPAGSTLFLRAGRRLPSGGIWSADTGGHGHRPPEIFLVTRRNDEPSVTGSETCGSRGRRPSASLGT
jgi:hypothetical protein